MNTDLVAIPNLDNVTSQDAPDTDTLLATAASVGPCSLHKMDSGWSFNVEIPTVLAGAEFKIRSGFNHPSARSAIVECLARVRVALKQ
jgi:hypothetical protein